jgi:hypothetical protein
MTIWYVDIMWALMLLGVALWTGCLLVFNPVMKSIRVMGMIAAYGIGVWMAITLPWLVALVTWCMFAAFGGAVALVYEVWARRRASAPRPTGGPLDFPASWQTAIVFSSSPPRSVNSPLRRAG